MFGRLRSWLKGRRKGDGPKYTQATVERMREYTLRQVQELVSTCDHVLTQAEVSEIDYFCYHNEYFEAVLTLARIIAEKKAMVPRSTINGIRKSLDGLAEADFLPENLDDCALDEKQDFLNPTT